MPGKWIASAGIDVKAFWIPDAYSATSGLRPTTEFFFGGGIPRYQWGGRTEDDSDAVCAIDRLGEELHRTFPAELDLQVNRGWTGVIGYTLDGLPSIQRSQSHSGVVQAVGWCGHGVALSIASGDWVARILCGESDQSELARVLMIRFAVQGAIDRVTLLAAELLGGMAFVTTNDVACLLASARALAFHPPSYASIASSLDGYLAGRQASTQAS
ncbi:MAG: FAD-dependent oxidoreductase [Fuerstiella sp.]|nr:FAD-dependent oxidoreductase [Fuerstiella sp.]